MKIILKKNQILLGLVFYKFLIEVMYIFFVHPNYSNLNFSMDFNAIKYFISFCSFIIVWILIPKNSQEPATIILHLHFMIMIIPIFSLYALKNESTIYFLMVFLCFSLECFIIKKVSFIKINSFKYSEIALYLFIIICTVLVYTIMIVANGLPDLRALNLLNIYDIRKGVEYPMFMGYLVSWQAKVINPLLITISMKEKKYKIFILFVLLQVILYLIMAQKSVLFIPLAIVLIVYFSNHKNVISIITFIGVIGCLGTFVLSNIFGILLPASIFVRRFLFIPAQMKFFYYDFISDREFLFFSEGIFGKIFDKGYKYGMKFSNVIGETYFNSPEMSANTGYLGSGYSNFGFTGMIIYSIIFTFILLILNSISKKVDKSIIIGSSLFLVIALNDTDLLTSLLTGGFILLIILLYLYSGLKKKESNAK